MVGRQAEWYSMIIVPSLLMHIYIRNPTPMLSSFLTIYYMW